MALPITPTTPLRPPARVPLTVIEGGRSPARLARRYRRRRLVAALVVLLLVVAGTAAVLAVVGAVTPRPVAQAPAPPVAGEAVVLVRPGDTLWSIARRLQPEGDVRPLVDRLAARAGGGPLQPGQRLAVPA